jgi:hypothetical protein
MKASLRKEADELAAAAHQRYQTLLEKHPAAFADHGTEFYLGPGKDPKRALELATLNLKVRDTPRARLLHMEAALAAGDSGAACKTADRALDGVLITGVRETAARSYESCGRSEDAARVKS